MFPYKVRPFRAEDAVLVAAQLRPEDEAECRAFSGETPAEGMVRSAETPGSRTWVVLDERDRYLAVYGVHDSGAVWALLTVHATDHPVTSARWSRWLLRNRSGMEHLPASTKLWCVAWDANRLHQRWLKFVGFQPGAPLALDGRFSAFRIHTLN